jgi:cytidine deaminase
MAQTSSTSSTHKRQISKQLVKTVKKAAAASHAPYSHINVGAVLYAAAGTMYAGTNIESYSYSLTMCAERVALFTALSAGVRDFQLLLVFSPQIAFIVPCGACLQVLSEFAPELLIVTMNERDEFKFLPIKTLLTKPFVLTKPVKG